MTRHRFARHRFEPIVFAAALIVALPVAPALAQQQTLLVFGDSLMAGYGLPREQGFVARLQAALDAEGLEIAVVDASVSGDTTEAGLNRLDWALGGGADAVLLGLGGNDMLRGLPVAAARDNLEAILDRLTADGIPVLIAGMQANRGLGPDYVAEFDALYPELAAAYDAALYPFLLDGVALDPALNQRDGMHPNARGVEVIVEAITPYVVDLLTEAQP